MIELTCKNCGATLVPTTQSMFKCEYCGATYMSENREGTVHYVQTCPAKTTKVAGQVTVRQEMLQCMPTDKVAEYTMRELTYSLAKALAPYVKVETMAYPCEKTQVIRGMIRVVEPDFRF